MQWINIFFLSVCCDDWFSLPYAAISSVYSLCVDYVRVNAFVHRCLCEHFAQPNCEAWLTIVRLFICFFFFFRAICGCCLVLDTTLCQCKNTISSQPDSNESDSEMFSYSRGYNIVATVCVLCHPMQWMVIIIIHTSCWCIRIANERAR